MPAKITGMVFRKGLGRLLALLVIALVALTLTTEKGGNALLRITESPQGTPSGREQAIVVLTGKRGRIGTAVELHRQNGLPLVIIGNGAESFVELANRLRVQPRMVEWNSMTTEENAAFGSCMLKAADIDQVFLVTEPLHGRRAMAWLQYYGLSPTLANAPRREIFRKAAHPLIPSTGGWQRSQIVLYEWAGLADFWWKRATGRRVSCPEPVFAQA